MSSMLMAPRMVLCLSLLCLTALASPLTADDNDGRLTAYQVLQQYDFPVGLLPKGALGYELDRATGKFTAYLNGTCSFSLEGSYQLRYKSKITGIISKDKLTGLNGVSVKVLFLWVNIIEVVREGNELRFSVGIASADFSIDNFVVCPQCGCGLDCVNRQVKKIARNPFVSSS